MNARGLTTPKENVQQLQMKLGHAAKENKKRRFHALYDKVYRMDILREAWRRVRVNKGAAGVDGETLADIEMYGEQLFLHECEQLLKDGKYHPQPVRRQYIPKKDGKMRPLGIPTVRDRVIQMAVKLVMEPIFEADFQDSSLDFDRSGAPSRRSNAFGKPVTGKVIGWSTSTSKATLTTSIRRSS
ncbi:reverse transcriptase family protein [Paenibacillus durus]|uniref:hypothetical protein n=1 Tax=Paenibacillus durus TaxID=44251 RepID=UPI00069B9E22|nr:hypothetical protein [Paenibacillus durus]